MLVSVSILSSDKRLECINELNMTSCDYIHVDVMDGKFVPDTQFSLKEIKAINYVSNKSLDVHLMVDNPNTYVDKLKGYKIEYITFHLECGQDVDKLIDKIHKLGFKVGLSIKPGTDIKKIEKYLSKIDLVLVMSVEPGKGGQKFLQETIERVNYLREVIDKNGYKTVIEVDGGINYETIKLIPNIDIAVVGSYITKGNNHYEYQDSIDSVVGKDKVEIKKEVKDTASISYEIANKYNNISRIISNIFVILGILLMVGFLFTENFDFEFLYFYPWISDYYKWFILGLILLGIGAIIKSLFSNNSKNKKISNIFYKILLVIGILPFVLLVVIGIMGAINGACHYLNCIYPDVIDEMNRIDIFGWEAFRFVVMSLARDFLHILIVGVILIIISVIKLKK